MIALSNLHAASLFFQPDAEAGDPLALEVVAEVAVLIDHLAAKADLPKPETALQRVQRITAEFDHAVDALEATVRSV